MSQTPAYTKGTLKNYIKLFLNRTDLEDVIFEPTNAIEALISIGRGSIQRLYNFPFMETTGQFNLVPPVAPETRTNFAFPPGFKQDLKLILTLQADNSFQANVDWIVWNDFKRLTIVSTSDSSNGAKRLIGKTVSPGMPSVYSKFANRFWLFPTITEADKYRVEMDYWQYLPVDITNQDDTYTDELLALNDTLLYWCLAEGAALLKDLPREVAWRQEAARRISEEFGIATMVQGPPIGGVPGLRN